MGHVESVNLAVVRTGPWTGRIGKTGIDKRSASGPVFVDETGVRGDDVCDTEHHGAWYQAVYAFDVEDYRHWSREVGQELGPGNAGENLSLLDCDASNAVIGERWRIGGAVLRVTGPRIPCVVFAGFWEAKTLIKRFIAHGRPGAYLAVEAPGEISQGDALQVLSRPDHGVTVSELLAFRVQRRTELADHVEPVLPDLPAKWRVEVDKLLRSSTVR